MNTKKEMIGFAFLLVILLSTGFASAVFVPGPSSDTNTLFNAGGAPLCIIGDDGSAKWVNYSGGDVVGMSDAFEDCYRVDGIIGEYGAPNPNCCPDGYICNGSCIEIPSDIYTCSDYKTETACKGHTLGDVEESFYDILLEGAPSDVTRDDLDGVCTGKNVFQTTDPDTGKCAWIVKCSCTWNGSDCNMNYNSVDCDDTDPPITTYNCSVQLGAWEDLCSSQGIRKIDWSVTLEQITNGDRIPIPEQTWCRSGSFQQTCPQLEAGLPFFTMFNLIITALAIVGIYFVWRKKE